MSSTPTVAVLLSETILSLYPILIKNVNTDLITQLFFRLGTYASLTGVLAERRDVAATWGSMSAVLTSLAYGAMNLVHIGSSYIGFAELPAGTAMSLFYTYPLLNILAGIFVLGERFEWILLPFFAVAILGVYFVSTDEKNQEAFATSDAATPKKSWRRGLIAIAIAALTETLIFVVAKVAPGTSNALYPMLQLYVGAFFLLVAGFVRRVDWSAAVPLTLFNVCIGFVGYLIRFYAIPLLPTAIFSILSFVGVVSAYMWGNVFAEEIPGAKALLGALLITGSIGGVRLLSGSSSGSSSGG